MSLITQCPSCERKLRVPDELLGLQVKCPSCFHQFTATDASRAGTELQAESPAASTAETGSPAASAGPAAPDAPAGPEDPPVLAPVQPEPSTRSRRCPACGVPVGGHRVRCPNCGESLEPEDDEEDRPWERRRPVRRDSEPHRGNLILVLGILSLIAGMGGIFTIGLANLVVGLPLGILGWVMGSSDRAKMRQNLMDSEGEASTTAGWICSIIGTIFGALGGMCCLGYLALIFVSIPRAGVAPPPTPPPAPRRKFLPEVPLLSSARPALLGSPDENSLAPPDLVSQRCEECTSAVRVERA